MKKLIIFLTAFLFFVSFGLAFGGDPKLEIRIFKGVNIQGVYFNIENLNSFDLYKIQLSEDLIKWETMLLVGCAPLKTEMESPLFEWHTLPPSNCFFRIVKP